MSIVGWVRAGHGDEKGQNADALVCVDLERMEEGMTKGSTAIKDVQPAGLLSEDVKRHLRCFAPEPTKEQQIMRVGRCQLCLSASWSHLILGKLGQE
jgi:hypothetical protein